MIHCPRCGTLLHLDTQSKEIDVELSKSKWGPIPEGFHRCKGCGLSRPDVWFESLQLDINTEIKLPEGKLEEVPEELTGIQEAGWNG